MVHANGCSRIRHMPGCVLLLLSGLNTVPEGEWATCSSPGYHALIGDQGFCAIIGAVPGAAVCRCSCSCMLLTRGEEGVIQDPPRCAAYACACSLCLVWPFWRHCFANLHTVSRMTMGIGMPSDPESRANEMVVREAALEWTVGLCLRVSCQRCMEPGNYLAATQMAMILEGFFGPPFMFNKCYFLFPYWMSADMRRYLCD